MSDNGRAAISDYSSLGQVRLPAPGTDSRKPIAIWLLLCCAAIFAMVVLGGVTRLTGSGLSMVEWEPLLGVIPPLNQTQWEETFRLYQQYPEYQLKNVGMSLEEFKGIFWFEYAHRLLGRAIGLIFFVPMVYFIIRGKVTRDLAPKLVIMFVLGGLQGLLGWLMVKSGLVADPHVSQYRLTAHLGAAFIIYAYIFWVALGLLFPQAQSKGNTRLGRAAYAVSGLIFITVLSGGFVAGLKAGLIFNTFPTMDGQWIPDYIFSHSPLWRNFFENMITVQFDHRVLAITVFIVISAFWFMVTRAKVGGRVQLGINLLLAALALQVTLGISTLLLHVPIALAAAHQAGALVLFTVSLFVSHALNRVVPARPEGA